MKQKIVCPLLILALLWQPVAGASPVQHQRTGTDSLRAKAFDERRDFLSDAHIRRTLALAAKSFPHMKELPRVEIIRSKKDLEKITQELAEAYEYLKKPSKTELDLIFESAGGACIDETNVVVIIPKNLDLYGGIEVADLIIVHEAGERFLVTSGYERVRSANLMMKKLLRYHQPDVENHDINIIYTIIGDILINTLILRKGKGQSFNKFQTWFAARKDFYRGRSASGLWRAYNLYLRALEITSHIPKGSFCEPDDPLEKRAVFIARVANQIILAIDQGKSVTDILDEDLSASLTRVAEIYLEVTKASALSAIGTKRSSMEALQCI